MPQTYKCLRCKQVFAVGDAKKELLPKCPHCGSKLTIITMSEFKQ